MFVKVFVCNICGDSYIGEEAPSRCPFCGAEKKNIVEAKDYDDTNAFDVELTENERANIEKALELELDNAAFYKCASKKTKELEGQKVFKILSKVEKEHASVWKKILNQDDVEFPKIKDCATDYQENLSNSHSREERAIEFYKKAGKEAKNSRVREIFEVFVEVETDHLHLSE
ncbi:MAG: ferritin family protein [Promethearchaeia archaeon]